MVSKKSSIIVGKRKKAVARATIKNGKGNIRINSNLLQYMGNRYNKMRINEPLHIAGELSTQVDISVNVAGGGISGQANAVRTAISKALIKYSKNKKLKEAMLYYDKSLLVSDARRTEPHKPSRSRKGPRSSKQQSKR